MQKNVKKLNEELEQLLQPLNEMSMAFAYKDKRIDVCAWVENPSSRDNRYFKYYNNSRYNNATKVARIRLDKPIYVGGIHKEKGLEQWILTDIERKELICLLNSPSDEYIGLTRWQSILIRYNADNFFLTSQQTINDELSKADMDPKMPKYIKPFPIDYPMPDYNQLKS